MKTKKRELKTDFMKYFLIEGRIENHHSPELEFMRGLCSKDTEKIRKYWSEKKFYGELSSVYMPEGIYTGYASINRMLEEWYDAFEGESMEVIPVLQFTSNGRSAGELIVRVHTRTKTMDIPMCIVAELHDAVRVEDIRVYHFSKWSSVLKPRREQIFQSDCTARGSDICLTGGMREYFNALHTPSLERILNMVDKEKIVYGGYRPDYLEPIRVGIDEFKEIYEHMTSDIPSRLIIRWETITVKNNIWIVEWNGFTNARVKSAVPCPPIGEYEEEAQCGVAIYEFNEAQKLTRISICDEYGLQYPLSEYPI